MQGIKAQMEKEASLEMLTGFGINWASMRRLILIL